MYEAIVTLVCVGIGDEPDYTQVHRIEFETDEDMHQGLDDMTKYCKVLNKEQLTAKGK